MANRRWDLLSLINAYRQALLSWMNIRRWTLCCCIFVLMVLGFTRYQVDQYSRSEYVANLSLMGGHLAVGRELVESHLPILAAPHFGHPVKEHWHDVEKVVGRQRVLVSEDVLANVESACGIELSNDRQLPFRKALDCLHKLAANSPNAPTFNSLFQAVDNKIKELLAEVPPEVALLGIKDVVNRTTKEYNASITRENPDSQLKVVNNAIEYQDARGFIVYIQQLSQFFEGQFNNLILGDLIREMPLKYSLSKSQIVSEDEYKHVNNVLKSIATSISKPLKN